jgi:hypothetical protein
VGLIVRPTVFPVRLCLWLTAEPGHIEPRPRAFLASDEPNVLPYFHSPKVGVSFVKSRFRTIQVCPKDLPPPVRQGELAAIGDVAAGSWASPDAGNKVGGGGDDF